jgi:hypothetical protein
MSKQLLREYYELCEGGVCQDLLTEDEKLFVKSGGLVLSGIMQKANQENGNGRIYSRRILQREIDNYQKIIEDRRALGELDHPDDSVVNLKNTSHMVTKMWWEGDNVMGKVKVLETPSGNILKSLVRGGVKLGISSRGLGSTRKESGKIIVEDDFQLICFDFVQEPSTPGAFMMSESKRRDINEVFSKADRLNRLLNDIIGN